MSRRGWALFAALSVIWGIPYLLIKIAVTDVDPLIVAFGRTLLAAVLLLPVVLYRRALMPVIRRWKWLLLYTVIEISGPWLLLGHAETRLNSSTAGLLIAVVPMIAAIAVTVTGHDKLDARRIAGLAIGFAGVAALVGLDINVDDLAAVGALLLVAVGYAIGPIIINRKLADLPPMGVIAASLIVAAAIYAPFTVPVWPARISAPALWSIVALAVVCTAAAFVIFFALIAEAGPARATVITYINPAVAITLGVLLLDEPFTIGMAIGFPLVIVGSVLATSRRAVAPAEATAVTPVTAGTVDGAKPIAAATGTFDTATPGAPEPGATGLGATEPGGTGPGATGPRTTERGATGLGATEPGPATASASTIEPPGGPSGRRPGTPTAPGR